MHGVLGPVRGGGDEMSLDTDVSRLGEETKIFDEAELAQVLGNLDKDRLDETGMSTMDFNSRLRKHEINAILGVDFLNRMGLLPDVGDITRQKKRLSVSLDGQGRKEKVDIVRGERMMGENAQRGFFNRIFSRQG